MPTARITKPYTAKSRPIIFNGEMVRAILDGRKTQTRRAIKVERLRGLDLEETKDLLKAMDQCPYGDLPGDKLWVKERIHRKSFGLQPFDGATFTSDFTPVLGDGPLGQYCGRAILDWSWKKNYLPSIFMPRWASRISLRIVDIKVERIQDISSLDIVKEGIEPVWTGMARDFDQEKWGYLDLSAVSPEDVIGHYENLYEKFIELWDSINAKKGYGWSENSWVWVIEFERIDDE